MTDQFTSEQEATTFLCESLHSQGWALTPQVTMRHFGGMHLRIDLIAVPGFPFPAEFVGIECKASYDAFTDFTAALKQGIDYRQSVIADVRLPQLAGKQPKWVFVYPGMTGYDGMTGGAERLAGKFNVGIITVDRGELRMFVNAASLWGSQRGLVRNAGTFSTNRHPGHL